MKKYQSSCIYFTNLRPLNRVLDCSNSWANSLHTFLSWSSIVAILTTIFAVRLQQKIIHITERQLLWSQKVVFSYLDHIFDGLREHSDENSYVGVGDETTYSTMTQRIRMPPTSEEKIARRATNITIPFHGKNTFRIYTNIRY